MDARVKFGKQELYINLLDSPIVKKWSECVQEFNRNSVPMKTHIYKAPHYIPLSYNSEQEVVENINSAIDSANESIVGKRFPYRAYNDMPWQQTNLIHRCFTTADTTKKTWKHNLGNEMMIQCKKESYLDKVPFMKKNVEQVFQIRDKTKFQDSIDLINRWVHHYEDLRSSGRSREFFNRVINREKQWYFSTLELDWDNYEGETRNWYNSTRASYTDIVNSTIDKKSRSCDIFLNVNITGKDYEAAYFEFDDLLEFDITNLDIINGGLRIYDKRYLDYLYGQNGKIINITNELGIPKIMVRPIPIGKVLWSSVEYTELGTPDVSKKYTDNTPAARGEFYRPTIEIINKKSAI